MPEQKSVLITDLDNTLWDWVGMWAASFQALLRELLALSGVPEAQLLKEIRQVHQRHGTSEYTFLVQEVPTLARGRSPDVVLAEYAPAIAAFRSARRDAMKVYPHVYSTLATLKRQGVRLVAYTESGAFYTANRLRKTGLDELLDYVYSPADHDLPVNMSPEQLRKYPRQHYELRHTVHRHTPPHEFKPNPRLLQLIIREIGATPQQCVYAGDSKAKDIRMAQEAGVADVWAAYGVAQFREQYELLRQVSHWTDADIQREKALMAAPESTPSHILESSIAELMSMYEFEAFSGE